MKILKFLLVALGLLVITFFTMVVGSKIYLNFILDKSKVYPAGTYNGRQLVKKYSCDDVCPDYGQWYVIYDRVNTKEECEKIGGTPEISSGWGGFIGCAPY